MAFTEEQIRHNNIVDDLETKRGIATSQMRSAESLLIDAAHALENGRLEIVKEFLDRATRHIHKGLEAQK